MTLLYLGNASRVHALKFSFLSNCPGLGATAGEVAPKSDTSAVLGKTAWASHNAQKQLARKLRLRIWAWFLLHKVKGKSRNILWLVSFGHVWFIVLKWPAYNHISTVAKPILEAGSVQATLEFYSCTKLLCIYKYLLLSTWKIWKNRRVNIRGPGLKDLSVFGLLTCSLFLYYFTQLRLNWIY